MHHEKAQYVDIFNEFSLTIFSNIVFQTSHEKYFIVKRNTFDKIGLYINVVTIYTSLRHVTILIWFYS